MRISLRFWDFILNAKPWRVLLFIFAGVFILRLPTLFVEYYDIDVLTSFIQAENFFSGKAYAYNKGQVYHWILNGSYWLFGRTAVSFHLAGIILISSTAWGIWLIGKKLFDSQRGLLAALLYGFCISAFNRQFMAINGEIVYNLFFVFSVYFFILFFFDKRWTFGIPLLLSLSLAVLTKFQGLWIVLALGFYLFFIHPQLSLQKDTKRKYNLLLVVGVIGLFLFMILDWNYSKLLFKGNVKATIEGFYSYVAVRGFNPFFFMIKLIHRVGLMAFYHSLLWIAGIVFIFNFFKSGEKKNKEKTFLVTITLFLFVMTFMAGQRLYFHYFVQVYPFLSLLAGVKLLQWLSAGKRTKQVCFRLLAFPLLFLFAWNVKDAVIMKLSPDSFYQESKVITYFRLAFLGQENDYLLPHESYLKALNYFKNQTKEDSTIYVWPEGAEFVYYAKRPSATLGFWFNVGALRCVKLKEFNVSEAKACEEGQIGALKQAKPDYFVDVSLSPRSDFYKLGGLEKNFKLFKAYLTDHYESLGPFGAVSLWRRIKP